MAANRRSQTIACRRSRSPQTDWKAEANRDVTKLFNEIDGFGLKRIREFCASNGLPTDDGYVMEFRRQAMLHHLRLATARLRLSNQQRNEPRLIPTSAP
jgi:hypothetical protein